MATSGGDRTSREVSISIQQPAGEGRPDSFGPARSAKGQKEIALVGEGCGDWAEAWREQLAQLPTEEQARILVGLLRPAELRELAAGLITDAAAGCKAESLPEVVEAVNGWVATAEEMATSRRKLRHILAARERMRSQCRRHCVANDRAAWTVPG